MALLYDLYIVYYVQLKAVVLNLCLETNFFKNVTVPINLEN